MRVAMLHADLPPEAGGGVAHQVSRLAEVLVGRGHDVTVRTLSSKPAGAGYDVESLMLPARSKAALLVGVPIAFAAGPYDGFDVVHAHGDSQLLWRRSVPVVRTFYGSAKDEAIHAERLRRRLSQWALIGAERLARRVATVTVGISDNTARSVGPLDAIIPCGVDLDWFRPGKKSIVPTVLFVGTIGGRKRGRLLVEAFCAAVRPVMPDAELWVVSPDRAEGSGVRWFGRVDDEKLAGLYRSAWVFCLPSAYEGFGVPYIEAMASGTAVIATPNAGACEVITPESGGMLVGEDNLGGAIAALLADAHRREVAEQRALAYVQRFRWAKAAEAYEAAYARAVELRREHRGEDPRSVQSCGAERAR